MVSTSSTQVTSQRTKRSGIGCLILFALPFAIAGFGVLFLGLWPIFQSMQAQSWTQVPAYIQGASVSTSKSSKGGSTKKLVARYWYEIDGKRYESDAVSFYRGSDNFDTFHEDRFEELRPFIGSSRPYRTFVNPSDVSSSVLFPVVRWKASGGLIIFGSIFALVGVGLIAAGFFGARKERDQISRERLSPDQPWNHRKEWAERSVTCSSNTKIIVIGILAFVVSGISSFIPVAIIEELTSARPNYAVLIFLVFPLAALALLSTWVVMLLRWKRFGTSRLTWNQNPLQRGSELKATLIAPRKLVELVNQIEITISCCEHLTTGSGKNRSTRTTTIAEQKSTVFTSITMGRGEVAHIPISIAIPQGGRSTQEHGNPYFSWRLAARASMPGADYSVSFEIPVFGS